MPIRPDIGRRAACMAIALATAGAALVACNDTETITETVFRTDTLRRTDTVRITVRDTVRFGNTTIRFDQIERLANPLVSEVFVDKREHGHFNTSVPADDRAQFTDDIVSFVRTVAGRSQGVADAISGTLVSDFARGGSTGGGDMLIVFMDRAAGVTAAIANDPAQTAGGVVGWLTYLPVPPLAGAQGFGGRKLRGDDTVDKGLLATFGPLLDAANVSAGLASDNVAANDGTPLTTFPYLPAPNSAAAFFGMR
jgi:hypothetical protein